MLKVFVISYGMVVSAMKRMILFNQVKINAEIIAEECCSAHLDLHGKHSVLRGIF